MQAKTLLLAMALATTLITPAVADSLQTTEVKALFPGRYVVKIFDRFDLRVNMRPDGVLTGESLGRKDVGRWSVENGKLCIAWNTWTKGSKNCSALRRDGNVIRGRGFSFRA